MGWCVLSHTVVSAGHLAFVKEDNLYQRLQKARAFLRELHDRHPFTSIAIEAPAKFFKAKSSANTMSLLQRWNGMLCAALAIDFNIEPQLIEATTARKLAGIAIAKGEPAKVKVVEHIQRLQLLPSETWKVKRTGALKDWCYDVADACVVAMAGKKKGP